MQRITKYSLLSALGLTLTLGGCSDKYFDQLISNPNQVTVPTLPSLLSTTSYKAGINSYTVATITSPFVQYIANPSPAAASDTYATIDYTGTWDALYFAMADANQMKQAAIAQGATEYQGVADVIISYNLGLVNDLWGAAPFSSAFDATNLYPKYDTDQNVYNENMALLDEAITLLSKTDSPIKLSAGSDLIYGSDAANERAKWLKFAYALKARLLNKVSKTASYNSAAVLAAVANSFTANSDDAGMATFVTRNNWASVAVSNASQSLGGWLSEQLIDALNGTTYGLVDPRLKKITDPTVNNTYIGTVNGAGNRPPGGNTTKDENYISQNSPWTSNTAPLLIVTYAELKFIEAEAYFRNNKKPEAYAAYLAGIRANMTKLTVPTTEQDAYINDSRVSVGANNLTLDLIFKEKYVVTYLNAEAWNDARRYDYKYKDFTLPVNAALPTFVRRLDYTQGESNKNGANVPAPVPMSTKLWWDQ